MLVAVEDVQPLAAHKGCQLAHRGLACARLTNQQRSLRVSHAPAHTTHRLAIPKQDAYNTLQNLGTALRSSGSSLCYPE